MKTFDLNSLNLFDLNFEWLVFNFNLTFKS